MLPWKRIWFYGAIFIIINLHWIFLETIDKLFCDMKQLFISSKW